MVDSIMATNPNRNAGRTFGSTFLAPDRGWRSDPSRLFPRDFRLRTYDPPETRHELEDEAHDAPKVTPLKVKSIDYNIEVNSRNHLTDCYELSRNTVEEGQETPAQLIVRRSQAFTLTLTFDRDYNSDQDRLELVLDIGQCPKVSKATQIRLAPDVSLRPRHWSASVQGNSGPKLTLAVLTPPDCVIGRWRLSVDSWLVEQKKDILRYQHPNLIYVLFNPYCRDDLVYMENETDVDEYIMNESGKIYSGNTRQITNKPWNFGQFDNPVLECCMTLLESMESRRLKVHCRGDPIATIRAISGIVNAQDDNGVLQGNWSGNYRDGTPPTHWTGSSAIIKEFFKTRESVSYGQCWVFSGVCTTVCRALGIPARSVTNFASAHDCDGSMTIDTHWDEKGNEIGENNDDSIWNFHVWNEAWMGRPDLDNGYGGWQVFDATPQETSGGYYCAGPVSVRSIKEGNVNFPHDGRFVFSEVNADKIHWILNKEGQWQTVVEKNKVGQKISTKRPRGQTPPKLSFRQLALNEDKDRLDLTDCYKFSEGTEAERAAVYKANTWSTRSGIYDNGKEDVKFELNQRDDVLVGNPFDVCLKIQNKSRSIRTALVTMSIRSIYYTGVPVCNGRIKTRDFEIELGAIKTEEAVMRIQAEEYLHLVVDQFSFGVSFRAVVKETRQLCASRDTYRLRRPDLEIEAPETCVKGAPFDVLIKFANSMPVHLTECQWMVEGTGLMKPKKYNQKSVLYS